jgi:hypothetical protein
MKEGKLTIVCAGVDVEVSINVQRAEFNESSGSDAVSCQQARYHSAEVLVSDVNSTSRA